MRREAEAEADSQGLSGAISEDSAGSVLSVLVTPRSGTTAIHGIEAGFLRLRVAAPPVDGAANKALVRFLAEVIDVAQSRVQIVAGEGGRRKRLRFVGVSMDELAACLERRARSG